MMLCPIDFRFASREGLTGLMYWFSDKVGRFVAVDVEDVPWGPPTLQRAFRTYIITCGTVTVYAKVTDSQKERQLWAHTVVRLLLSHLKQHGEMFDA